MAAPEEAAPHTPVPAAPSTNRNKRAAASAAVSKIKDQMESMQAFKIPKASARKKKQYNLNQHGSAEAAAAAAAAVAATTQNLPLLPVTDDDVIDGLPAIG
jgi:hypothetical protein